MPHETDRQSLPNFSVFAKVRITSKRFKYLLRGSLALTDLVESKLFLRGLIYLG